MKSFLTGVALFAANVIADTDIAWTSLGKFDVKNAAFPAVSNYGDGSEDFLLVSSFGAISSGQLYVVPNIKDAVTNGDASSLEAVKLETGGFVWPNMVKTVPMDVFGTRAISVPDGFLVPLKTNGGIYVVEMDPEDITSVVRKVKISPDKRGFFHHMGEWIDMNGDGRLDYVTARSNAKKGDGELVWFEHPEGGLDVSPWPEHVVCKGPDVAFTITTDAQFPDEIVVFATEFFNEQFALYRVSTIDGTFVDSRVIDDTTLAAYSVEITDLNNDGNRQLLMNNHETKSSKNGIWAYDIPEDWMNGEFTKRTIMTNFDTVFSLFVPAMAPGFPYARWPNGQQDGGRPHIFVAGDGDYKAHDLYATDAFTYEDNVIADAKGTVGALDFSDEDGDGWMEVWMPNYDKSYIEVFKLHAPETKLADIVEVPTEFLQ